MKWNVFSLEAVKEALKPKFVLEKVRYVTDDEEYGEGESTRFVFRNVEEMPEIDYIKRTMCNEQARTRCRPRSPRRSWLPRQVQAQEPEAASRQQGKSVQSKASGDRCGVYTRYRQMDEKINHKLIDQNHKSGIM